MEGKGKREGKTEKGKQREEGDFLALTRGGENLPLFCGGGRNERGGRNFPFLRGWAGEKKKEEEEVCLFCGGGKKSRKENRKRKGTIEAEREGKKQGKTDRGGRFSSLDKEGENLPPFAGKGAAGKGIRERELRGGG